MRPTTLALAALVATLASCRGLSAEPGRGLDGVRDRAGRLLDVWEEGLRREAEDWGEEADREAAAGGGRPEEPPSATGRKLRAALAELAEILQRSLLRSESRKKGDGGGIDSLTISTSQSGDKKKSKKKKKKPPGNLHVHQAAGQQGEKDKGVRSEGSPTGAPSIREPSADEELVGPTKTRIKREEDVDDEDLEDGRGKKKKKKAILKLLLLGAVLKAKLSLLLQLFSAHLQVKFFAIALAGLALNIARFWFDLKKGHQPQKVIYYEHAQHQHHYDHEDDHGWGGWSRSMDEKPTERQGEISASPDDRGGGDPAFGGWIGRSRTSRSPDGARRGDNFNILLTPLHK